MPEMSELQGISAWFNECVRIGIIKPDQAARGWIMRLVNAGMEYAREGQTQEGWEKLMAVVCQAEMFFEVDHATNENRVV